MPGNTHVTFSLFEVSAIKVIVSPSHILSTEFIEAVGNAWKLIDTVSVYCELHVPAPCAVIVRITDPFEMSAALGV